MRLLFLLVIKYTAFRIMIDHIEEKIIRQDDAIQVLIFICGNVSVGEATIIRQNKSKKKKKTNFQQN